MAEQKLFHADREDPLRCQALPAGSDGQCRYKSWNAMRRDGDTEEPFESHLCPKHAGDIADRHRKKKLHEYRLSRWKARHEDFAGASTIKNLQGEIGILRMTLEEVLNSCHTTQDLLLHAPHITHLAEKIEKLITSCTRIEQRQGAFLDKSSSIRFAGELVDIIANNITDPEVIDRISHAIIRKLEEYV